jgi:hypothetical protein
VGASDRVITILGFVLGRCPFLALWQQQRPAKRGKARQRAKPKNREILRGLTQGPPQISKGRQSAANGVFSAC